MTDTPSHPRYDAPLAGPGQSRFAAAFVERFGGAPTAMARAPGRVNLIGEHTDYNGLPVLPMALTRGIAIVCRPRDDGRVVLENTEARFPPVQFELGATIPPEPAGAWGNYPRAAAQALWGAVGPLRGLEGLIESTLPVSAGLSSSSAMVVATALALLDRNGARVEARSLMDLLARGERYVGLQGGGMDQAVSLGGRPGHAVRIDFQPGLVLTPVPLPADWRVVVAQSLVKAAKAAGARDAYNTRVRECREALERFSRKHLTGNPPANYAELAERMAPGRALDLAALALDDVLLRRFRHVVSEGVRVDLAVSAMGSGHLAGMGRLLQASHRSLRDDYEVSSAELDELCRLAESAGAAGARLTGAGFGGCIVALAAPDRTDAVLEALRGGYYRPRGIVPDDRHCFVAEAGPGAAVTSLVGVSGDS